VSAEDPRREAPPSQPADTGAEAATPDRREPPGGQVPKKRKNWWVWVSAALALVAAGLLIWALALRSDRNEAEQDANDLQTQLDQREETGGTVVTAAKGLFEDLTAQLGATSEDLAATEQDLKDANGAAADAEKAAADAKKKADSAANQTDKAKAETNQAKADAKAAESKAAVAADCAKAYVSAIGSLFEGDDVRAQAAKVSDQLKSITGECQAALGGT
jgi:hypothetical protein